jgi:3-hydroxyisobutyrate dehydrogenase-like beta-hydroxyacid dehydrogenase
MKISVLGMGLMGVPIGLRLQHCGHEVLGWNRSTPGLQRAQSEGLVIASDLTAALTHAEMVILTLSDAMAIDAVLFNDETPALLDGRLVVQMGTISPDQSRQISSRLVDGGGEYLEAPVLGSIPEARAGALIVMAGGPEQLFQRSLMVLQCLGNQVEHVGAVGQGAAMKLAMNQLIASLTVAFSLSLGVIRAEGVEVEQFMGLLRQSALYAPTFDKKLAKMLEHNYASPNFPLKHLIKDLGLFRLVAEKNGMEFTITQTMLEVLEKGSAAGYADEDYSALYEAINPGFDMDVDEGC